MRGLQAAALRSWGRAQDMSGGQGAMEGGGTHTGQDLVVQSPALTAGGGVAAEKFTHEDAVVVHRLLGERLSDKVAAAEWKARCAKVFRWSGYFEGADRVRLPYDEEDVPAVADANGVADALQGVSLN